MTAIAFFILKFLLKGDVLMMAMFFAQRVILGKTAFSDVPAVLKDQVRELLVDAGLGELAVE
jgi:hypothetical protein